MLNALTVLLFSAALSSSTHDKDSESGDTTSVSLDSVIVVAQRNTSGLRTADFGSARMQMSLMEDLPKILGNSDPIHYAQMLPGIQTNGEMRSGLNIQGCDNQHTQFSIGGVPLYGVSHLLGIFSAFNPSHYEAMSLEKTPLHASSPTRLGGCVDMQLSDVRRDSLGGILNVGLISSQGTIHLPLSRKTQLTVSGRGSYLNLLYGPLLRINDYQVRYGFFDANATLRHQLNRNHSLMLDFYIGQDRAHVGSQEEDTDISCHWGSHEAALHWLYRDDNGWRMHHTLYNTRYFNETGITYADIYVQMPSYIMDFGYKGMASYHGLSFGADYASHVIQPQNPVVESPYNTTSTPQPRQISQELSLWSDYRYAFSSHLNVNGGLRYTMYHVPSATYHSADPSVSLNYRPVDGVSLSMGYAIRHQNLFQAGISSVGLPCEFWLSASGIAGAPQWGHGPSASATWSVLGGRYKLSLDAYYKWLYNQVEYSGNYLDLFVSTYNLTAALLHGHGCNYGASAMLSKCTGRLTGWLSYSWGRAMRTYAYPNLNGTFPANHERVHELDALLTWKVGRRWTLGGTYVFSSGTPFTAPVSFYVQNGSLITEYSEHNANRLPVYMRLDVSANVRVGSMDKHCQHSLNVSCYNVTGRYNVLYYSISVMQKGFQYAPYCMMPYPLPSISYTLKF